MKKTPFNDLHKQAGARLIDFGGWEMPVQFQGILAEHKAVREKAGLFDIAHMGQVWVWGEAFEFLQKITTNDVSKLNPGQGQYTLLCREDGGVVDDLYVYKLDEHRYFLVVNASRRGVDVPWLKSHAGGGVKIEERMDGAGVALQGPSAEAVARFLFPGAMHLKKNEIMELPWEGSTLVVSCTGYTGEEGFEVFGETPAMVALYPRILAAGAVPCGLGARDTLRLEMGYRLYGNDLDEKHSALEAGLGWVVKIEKGDFLGRDSLLREKEKGPSRRLTAFKLKEKGVPRHGHEILFNGQRVGEVTSGTFSPSLSIGIGMGYVDAASFPKGAEGSLAVKIHDRAVPAEAAVLPFYIKPHIL